MKGTIDDPSANVTFWGRWKFFRR